MKDYSKIKQKLGVNSIIIDDLIIDKIKTWGNNYLVKIANYWKGEDLLNPSDKAENDLGFLVIQSTFIL